MGKKKERLKRKEKRGTSSPLPFFEVLYGYKKKKREK